MDNILYIYIYMQMAYLGDYRTPRQAMVRGQWCAGMDGVRAAATGNIHMAMVTAGNPRQIAGNGTAGNGD